MADIELHIRRKRSARMEAAVFAALFIGAALIPRWLTPDARGYGTHEQLFLPKCMFHEITTLPCPTCGLTTSFAHLTHGHLAMAFRTHPAGPLIYVMMVVGGVYCLVWALTGWHPLHKRLHFVLRPVFLLAIFAILWLLALLAHFTWQCRS
ncbi:MAG: DUF2752 domain-containing protein [Candidatus Zipacnadales bacterium]